MPSSLAPIAPIESAWRSRRQGGRSSVRDRNSLAHQNDKLALKIAHRMAGQCAEEVEDLAQIARIGLLKACAKYEPDKGVAFSSFAVPYIQGEIQHFLRDHWGTVKVPRRAFETAAKVKAIQKTFAKSGREVDAAKVASALGICSEKWRFIAEATQRKPVASLDEMLTPLADEDDSEQCDREALRSELLKRVACLPKLERECLIEFYWGQLSEDAIARKHRTTAEMVHRLLEQAMADLLDQLKDVAQC